MELSDLLTKAAERSTPLPPPIVQRLLRRRAHLTQDDVAAVLGVRRATIARYELGQREARGALRAQYADLLRTLAEAQDE